MKYRLLKKFEKNSISTGEVFDVEDDELIKIGYSEILGIENGSIRASVLVQLGFIEEVKDSPKPRWKVGDRVMFRTSALVITTISPTAIASCKSGFLYNGWMEDDIRDPTPEELELYFR